METNLFEVTLEFSQGHPDTLTFVVDLLRCNSLLDDIVKEIFLTAPER